MEGTRDFGIAVADAIRLNDCFNEMQDAFAAHPAQPEDYQYLRKKPTITPSTPESEEWIHRVNSAEVAERYIRGGIMDRRFPLWIRTASTEEMVDYYAVVTVESRTLTTGLYMTHTFPRPYLYGRPLWVKSADWRRFFDSTMAERYGVGQPGLGHIANPDARPTKEAITEMIRTVHAEGAKGRAIPKAVRKKPGFEGVKYQTIMELSAGMFARVGRAGSKPRE